MAISRRQQSPITVVSANASSVSATLPMAPVAGNKLVFLAMVDKAAGTFTAPSGFTIRQQRTATSISLVVCEKTSDGTETSALTASWTGTVTRPKAMVVELQGSGTVSYDNSAQNGTETNVTSLASGTVTTGAGAAYALVLFGNDSAKAVPTDPDPVPSFTGGSFTVVDQNWFATGGIGEPGFVLGEGPVSPSSTASTTATFTGATADQMAGAIITFSEDGDTTSPTLSSATVGTDGTTVTIALSEAVSIGAGGNGGFTISPSGGAATLSYVSGSGTSSLVYTASRTIYSGETLTISYTQPGNGVEDLSGNDLASFGATSVTNSSTQVLSSSPTISGLSTTTPVNGATLVISGNNFGASTGTVTLAGASLTVSSWSNTSISVVAALGNNKYSTNASLVVTTSGAVSTAGTNIQILPASGVAAVNLSGTLASSGTRITATPDLASGDQLEISNVIGGSISDVTVNADATFSTSSGVTAFTVRVNDGTGWGTAAVQTIATSGSTAPTLTSATVGTAGNTISLVFSASVSNGVGGTGGFVLSSPGGSATLSYVSGSGSSTLVFSISRVIKNTESGITLAYTQPGNGVEDGSGNDVASFTGVAVTNSSTQNVAPTDISISSSTISSASTGSTIVGTLSSTDADYGDTFTYTLVSGTGSTDNASFTISGGSLFCTNPSALGTSTRSVRIRTTDSASNTFEKIFTINLVANVGGGSSGPSYRARPYAAR